MTNLFDGFIWLPTSTNENRQEPVGRERWSDVISLLAVSDDGETAIATQFGLYHSLGIAALQICVWLPERQPIVLVESELEIPDRLWEVRGSGLWVEHVCETPLDHWSYGLEAFALEIDDPQELLGRGHGTRVPLGWELEFEASQPGLILSETSTPSGGDPITSSYRQHGSVHGLLLTKSGSIEFNGNGIRSHSWGPDAATAFDPLANHGVGKELVGRASQSVALPVPGHVLWVDYQPSSVPTMKSEPHLRA